MTGPQEMTDRRTYDGLSDSPDIVGAPRASDMTSGDSFAHVTSAHKGCPYCKCKRVFRIEVDLDNGDDAQGLGIYVGCPACPWASTMMIVAD